MPTVKDLTESMKNVTEKITDTGKKLQRRYNRYADKRSEADTGFSDEAIIKTVIRIPAVRIDRLSFLSGQFADADEQLKKDILEKGPVEAGVSREELKKRSAALSQKTAAKAFLLDVPEKILETLPLCYETLSFYAAAVQVIEQIAYLYGESDFWRSGDFDEEKTAACFTLYYGVMSGSEKAAKALRLLSSSVASRSFHKLTENFLEKAYQPLFKPAAKALRLRMPKFVFNKLTEKVLPIIKKTASDGLTLSSLLPMANRLIRTLDEAQFAYSAADFEKDWYEMEKDMASQPEP